MLVYIGNKALSIWIYDFDGYLVLAFEPDQGTKSKN